MKKKIHNTGPLIWGSVIGTAIIFGMIPQLISGRIPEIMIKLYGQTIFQYSYLFLAGAFLAEYRKKYCLLLLSTGGCLRL